MNQEEKLIRAAQLNYKAFGPLYERYFDAVFGFVFNKTMNHDLAGDITSQTFVKAMHNIKKYEMRGVPFQYWLFRIALNEIRMFFRKNPNVEVSISEAKLDQVLASQHEDVSDDEKMKRRVELVNALNELSAEDVEIIELRFFEERSFKEVAMLFNCSEDAAKKRVYRLVVKLRSMMGGMS